MTNPTNNKPVTIRELIQKLSEKDQNQVVEYVIADPDSQLVLMHLEKTMKSLSKMLKTFARMS